MNCLMWKALLHSAITQIGCKITDNLEEVSVFLVFHVNRTGKTPSFWKTIVLLIRLSLWAVRATCPGFPSVPPPLSSLCAAWSRCLCTPCKPLSCILNRSDLPLGSGKHAHSCKIKRQRLKALNLTYLKTSNCCVTHNRCNKNVQLGPMCWLMWSPGCCKRF